MSMGKGKELGVHHFRDVKILSTFQKTIIFHARYVPRTFVWDVQILPVPCIIFCRIVEMRILCGHVIVLNLTFRL